MSYAPGAKSVVYNCLESYWCDAAEGTSTAAGKTVEWLHDGTEQLSVSTAQTEGPRDGTPSRPLTATADLCQSHVHLLFYLLSILINVGGMYKVMWTFVCRGCVNPVTGTGHTSVDIGGDANLELVDKFCYLGVMLSVDGDADAAVETRIWIGWLHSTPLYRAVYIKPQRWGHYVLGPLRIPKCVCCVVIVLVCAWCVIE